MTNLKKIKKYLKYIFFERYVFGIRTYFPNLIPYILSTIFFYILALLYRFPRRLRTFSFKEFHHFKKDVTPFNLKEGIFSEEDFFVNKKWSVQVIKKAQVNSRGIIFNHNGKISRENFSGPRYILETTRNLKDRIRFISDLCKDVVTLPFLKTRKYKRAFVATDIHSNNYYHWICEYIPRIMSFEKNKELVLLLPESIKKKVFVREILDLIGVKYDYISRFNKIVVDKLYVPDFRADWFSFTKRDIEITRKLFMDNVDKKEGINKVKSVYLSRRDSDKRNIINEKEFVDNVEKKGISVVSCEGMGVLEQAKMFSNVDLLIAPHGAGLVNMIFMKKNSVVIEIVGYKSTNTCFIKLSKILGLKHLYLLVDNCGLNKGVHFGNMKVNIDYFNKFLQKYFPDEEKFL